MSKIDSRRRRIFEPALLGTLPVKNCLIMAPMGTRLASEIGGVTQRQIDYYAERARGGVGTIITEVTCVDSPLGMTGPKCLCLHDNAYIGGHNELVEAVQTFGTKIICQLVHAGRQTKPESIQGLQPVAPSAILCKYLNVFPRELSLGEIEGIIEKFIQAARRSKTSGYDGVELHGAHGYLIAQFMSSSTNQRKDRYGGDLRHRMNFPLEIIRGIKNALGKDYPLLFRISAEEFVEGGRSLEETKQVAQILEAKGVHVLHVSAGTYDSMTTVIEPMSYGEAWKIYLAEEVKKAVKIPVIGVGVIRSPSVAEKILEDGRVDFLSLGRALVADPHWPSKAKEGRDDEIIKCISCNIGCIGGRISRDLPMRCAVNPLTGREREYGVLVPAARKKRVLVIGGGPAGMEAARIAKMREHHVTLVEKDAVLGGQLKLAAIPPGKDKITWYSEYLVRQLSSQKIKVLLNRQVNLAFVQKLQPDVVIVATGAIQSPPDIPGMESPRVVKAWDVLAKKEKVEGHKVVIAGGGTLGCETALFLAPKNPKVTVIEMMEGIALEMEPINRIDLLAKIQQAGVEVFVRRIIQRVTEQGVIVSDADRKEGLIQADRVVLALGVKADDSLFRKLAGRVHELYVIGDSRCAGKIIDAAYDGARIARLI